MRKAAGASRTAVARAGMLHKHPEVGLRSGFFNLFYIHRFTIDLTLELFS